MFNNPDFGRGLGNLLNTPLARGALRYWWVSAPIGLLGWHYWKQRQEKGEKPTIGHLIQDMAPVLSVVGAMVALNSVLDRQEQKAAASAMPPGPIRDAQFTAQPAAAQPVGEDPVDAEPVDAEVA